jgi:HK97 family phage major capsid protein
MKTLNQLQDERGRLWEQMRDLANQAKKEGRELTTEEDTRVDAMLKDHNALESQISRKAKLEDVLKAQAEQEAKRAKESKPESKEDKAKRYNDTFWKYQKKGRRGLNSSELDLISKAQTTISDTAGGYMIPQGFSNQLHEEMALWGGMLEVCQVINTETGNQIDWPTEDDTGNTGALLAETVAASEQDVTIGQKQLEAWTFTSKLVRVQNQLLQDSFFNLPAFLQRKFARRLGTAENSYFTTGSGSSQPNGFVNAASVGETSASNATVTGPELIDLIHSVNRVYRRNARFMLNDASLAIIKKLTIGTSGADNRPLWTQDLRAGEPGLILGHEYTINPDMADFGAGAKPIAFGDFSYYLIRRAGGIVMMRLSERYAEYNQTGFVAFDRVDGELLSTNAIKMLRNPTT